MPDSNASQRAAQARSLAEASNLGNEWTLADLDFVLEFEGDTAEDLAAALKRSVYAIQSVRYAISAGKPVGGGHGRQQAPQARTYTFIDGDCPDDW